MKYVTALVGSGRKQRGLTYKATRQFLDGLGFLFHRPRFHGRTSTAIVVQGLGGGGRIRKYLEFVGFCLGFNVVKGSCITSLEPLPEKDRKKTDSALARQSRRFHEQLLEPAHAAPSLFQLMAFRMARTSIRQMLDDGYRDHTYYRDRGWFASDYYCPTTLGPLKKAVGAIFDWLFARIYKRGEPAPPLAASASAPGTPAKENAR